MRLLKSLAVGVIVFAAGLTYAQDRAAPAPTLLPSAATRAVIPSTSVPTAAPGSASLTKADVDQWLDGYLPYAMRSGDIPGGVVTVVKDGQILTARGFGYSNVAARTPVDPDRTLFRPGSISKLFTWTAAMQLVEQHKLDLDRDVNAYLDFKIPPYDGKPVTLRQLMTHTAGFEEVAKGVVFYDPKYDLPLDQYLKRWVPVRIFAPGTTPAYSNWGTALAAYLVQRASGEPFAAYLDHHIFGPLGMRNSTFRVPLPNNLSGQLATGYPKPGVAGAVEYVGPGPAGEASLSGTDMGRFMIAHLQNGMLDGNRILMPQTAEMMHNSPLDRVNPMSLVPPLSRMELGFFETNINGREVIGHLGDTAAFHSSLHLFMKEGVGIYFSFNSPGKAGAVQPLRTALFQDFADRYLPNIAPPDGRVDAKIAAQHAQMMAGRWWASRRAETTFLSLYYGLAGQAQVTVNAKGELVVPSIVGANGRPREWVEIAPFVWRDRYGHDRLAAKVVDGNVVRWSYDFASPFEVFDRVPAYKNAAWLLPALYISLAILLLTFVLWPIAWFSRRRYKVAGPLTGRSLQAYRASRLLAGLDVALLVTWGIALTSILGDNDAAAGGGDTILILLQLAGIIIFVGAVLTTGWNLWTTWTDGRKWTGRVWSALLFFAALVLLYIAVVFHLMTVSALY